MTNLMLSKIIHKLTSGNKAGGGGGIVKTASVMNCIYYQR